MQNLTVLLIIVQFNFICIYLQVRTWNKYLWVKDTYNKRIYIYYYVQVPGTFEELPCPTPIIFSEEHDHVQEMSQQSFQSHHSMIRTIKCYIKYSACLNGIFLSDNHFPQKIKPWGLWANSLHKKSCGLTMYIKNNLTLNDFVFVSHWH